MSWLTKKQKDLICTDCGHVASSPWNMERHVETKHLNKKDTCQHCNKQYSLASLPRHVKANTGAAIIRCSDCDFETWWLCSLKLHKKNQMH